MQTIHKTTFGCLTLCLLLIFLVADSASSAGYSEFAIPKPEKAQDIKYHSDEGHKSKSITFTMLSENACEEVIGFYDSELLTLTLVPFSEDGVGDAIWRDEQNHETSFKKGSPMRFIKSWADKEHTVRFFLTIIPRPDSVDGMTICSSEAAVFDFYSLSSLQSFFDSLTKEEKNHLMMTISKYTDKNGVVDIKTALEEHPEDSVLRKFANFQETQQAKSN